MTDLAHRNVYFNPESRVDHGPSTEDTFAIGVLIGMKAMTFEERDLVMSLLVMQWLADRSIEVQLMPEISVISKWIAQVVGNVPAVIHEKRLFAEKERRLRTAQAEGRIHPEHRKLQ